MLLSHWYIQFHGNKARVKAIAVTAASSYKWVSSFLTAHQHSLGYLVPVMVSWIENYNQKGLNLNKIN